MSPVIPLINGWTKPQKHSPVTIREVILQVGQVNSCLVRYIHFIWMWVNNAINQPWLGMVNILYMYIYIPAIFTKMVMTVMTGGANGIVLWLGDGANDCFTHMNICPGARPARKLLWSRRPVRRATRLPISAPVVFLLGSFMGFGWVFNGIYGIFIRYMYIEVWSNEHLDAFCYIFWRCGSAFKGHGATDFGKF